MLFNDIIAQTNKELTSDFNNFLAQVSDLCIKVTCFISLMRLITLRLVTLWHRSETCVSVSFRNKGLLLD